MGARVTVVMAVYNVEAFVGQAVRSVLSQTLKDWRLIAVDDGSNDGTVAEIKRYQDSRIQCLRLRHCGAPACVNQAAELAQTEYLSFLDGDDLWEPDKLQRHIRFLDRHPEIDLTFSLSRIIDEHGRDTGFTSRYWDGPIKFGELLEDNVIGNGSALVLRRKAFLQIGGYDESLKGCYDLDAWLRMAFRHPTGLHAIPEYLTLYRRRKGQTTKQVDLMEHAFNQVVENARSLDPETVRRVEKRAKSNMQRFFAFATYENREYARSAMRVLDSFLRAPLVFSGDIRNWKLCAAILAGALLPSSVHDRLICWASRAAGSENPS